MYYAGIKCCNIANGPGCRTALFVSGCTHHCEGCFNQEAWDFKYGWPFTKEIEDKVLDSIRSDYIRGLTILGGEPMENKNASALIPMVNRIKKEMPGKSVWCYSGYTWEEIISRHRTSSQRILLSMCDVLVDGEFHIKEKDIRLRFRGSTNQRIIDVPASISQGQIVLWDSDKEP